jgi:hypothetical protein
MDKPPRIQRPELPVPYEVGYGKPPATTRFRKGSSGNPKGRKKGSKNRLPAMNEERLKDIVMSEAYRGIKVNDGNRQVTIPMAQAIIRSLALNAAKGQHRSQRLFAELLRQTETSLKASHDEWLSKAIDYKADWVEESARRKCLGIVTPDPIPHPDDLEIDMKTGRVLVKGPFTPEEHHRWTELAKRRDDSLEQIAYARKKLAREKDEGMRQLYEQEIAHEQHLHDIITAGIGIWPNRDPSARLEHETRQKLKERQGIPSPIDIIRRKKKRP